MKIIDRSFNFPHNFYMDRKSNIIFFCKYSRLGASSRMRTLQYLPFLEKKGFNITVNYLFSDAYLKKIYNGHVRFGVHLIKSILKRIFFLYKAKKFDLIWVEKELFPYCPFFIERLFLKKNISYIVDFDDAIFHNYDRSSQWLVRILLKNKINYIMQNSKCVIVGNSYLGEKAWASGAKKVVKIPTVVDIERYKYTSKVENESLIIGWIGTPSSQKYLIFLADVFRKLNKKFNITVFLVGANSDVLNVMDGVNVKMLPWSERSEVEIIKKIDIGLMPLKNGPWEKGKCGYKLIQYMACGKPVIATPVGVNVEIIKKWNCGLLAETKIEWEQCLSDLILSSRKRNEFGNRGRKAVEMYYSLQVQKNTLLNALDEVIELNDYS